ncbi:MAG TPA: IS256 family transposase, partial [Parafilimonas sp.]|nr:IS256 family transposase [Parafilimonas sp.]
MEEKNRSFDFDAFAKQAAEELKAGKPMVGRDGVFTPLLKHLIEASLEGELDAHLQDTRKLQKNRRNGHGRKN